MKKMIIGIGVLIIISVLAISIYEFRGNILINDKIRTIETNVNKNQLKTAQSNLINLENRNYNLNKEEQQEELKLKVEIQNLSYNNLQPFLNNSKLEGIINNKYGVTMVLDKCKKIDGDIIATEYYNNHPKEILDLKIISDDKNKCTIEESCNGDPIGIYELSFNDKNATGTYEYFPTGKTAPVTMEFKK